MTATNHARTRLGAATSVVALVAAVVAGCSGDTDTQPRPAGREKTVSPTTSSPTFPSTADPAEADPMRLQITIGDQQLGATLDDSAAVRDLAAQLPVTVDLLDHGGVEKSGPLPSRLSTQGQPEGADPAAGDLGYYAPGGDLVLYYGDQSYFPGIIVLGRLDGDATARLADLDGPVTVRVAAP